MAEDDSETPIPMGMVMFKELELIGSHGMQAHAFGPMLDMITTGKLQPGRLINRKVSLEEGIKVLKKMGDFPESGVVVINQFWWIISTADLIINKKYPVSQK